jgi:hypothetical protein
MVQKRETRVMKRLLALVFCLCATTIHSSMAGDSAAAGTFSYSGMSINFEEYRGMDNSWGVRIPPARYLHAPDSPVTIEEVTAPELKKLCQTNADNACIVVETKYAVTTTHALRPCVTKYDQWVYCHVTHIWETPVSVTKIIVIPRVGEPIGQTIITPAIQIACLIHEIGHFNGWPADHPYN